MRLREINATLTATTISGRDYWNAQRKELHALLTALMAAGKTNTAEFNEAAKKLAAYNAAMGL